LNTYTPKAVAAPTTGEAKPVDGSTAHAAVAVTMPARAMASTTATEAAQEAVTISTIAAIVRARGADLHSTPGGSVAQALAIGASLNATGRSADGNWLYVETAQTARGWVESSRVVIFGANELAVLESDSTMAMDVAADAQETTVVDADQEATADTAMTTAAETNAATTTANTTSQSNRPAPILQEGQVAAKITLTNARLNVRAGPGTNYAVMGKAYPDERYVALARNSGSSWIQIALPETESGFGWVSAQYATVDAAIGDLAVSTETSSAPVANTTDATQAAPATDALTMAAPLNVAMLAPNQLEADEAIQLTAGSAASIINTPSIPTVPVGGAAGTLVFQDRLGGTIYAYHLGNGNLWPLTGGMDPAISPDGRMVAFTRFGNDGGLFVIHIDGSNEQRLHADNGQLRSPKWSPDGQQLLFTRITGEFTCLELGFGICIPPNPFLTDFPEADKPERSIGVVRLHAQDRDDGNKHDFRELAALNTAQAPDWNEAGIVYQATTSIEITADQREAETRAVVNQVVGFQDPDWQPGGGRILYQDRSGTHTEIWALNPDGSGVAALTRPETTLVDQLPSNVSPAWSPNGQQIVYMSNREANEEAGAWRLWIMDADGGNKRPLPLDIQFRYDFNVEQMASWGPSL